MREISRPLVEKEKMLEFIRRIKKIRRYYGRCPHCKSPRVGVIYYGPVQKLDKSYYEIVYGARKHGTYAKYRTGMPDASRAMYCEDCESEFKDQTKLVFLNDYEWEALIEETPEKMESPIIYIKKEKEKEKQKRRERKKKKRKLRIPQKEQTQELQNILKDIDEKIARVDVYLLSKECEDKEEENHL